MNWFSSLKRLLSILEKWYALDAGEDTHRWSYNWMQRMQQVLSCSNMSTKCHWKYTAMTQRWHAIYICLISSTLSFIYYIIKY